MTVHTSAGSRILIGTTASNPLTDTYVEIAEVTNIPEFGATYSTITHSSLGNRNVLKFKGQRDDGTLALDLALSSADAGQQAAQAALKSDFDYNFRITANDPVTGGAAPQTVTISVATPGVVSLAAHGFVVGNQVAFSTTGALPSPLVAGQTYYVTADGLTANAFSVSATLGGASIATTTAGTGVNAVVGVGTPTIYTFKAKVMGFPTIIGNNQQVTMARLTVGIQSGSIVVTAAT